jgi:hypothetical protein
VPRSVGGMEQAATLGQIRADVCTHLTITNWRLFLRPPREAT